MSARIPPGFAEIHYRFHLTGDPEPMECTLGVDLSVGTTGDLTLTNGLLTTMEARFDDLISSDYTSGDGTVVYGQDGPDDIVIESTNTPTAGLGASGAEPQNVAILVKKTTASAGRRGRGRMFVPGTNQDVLTSLGVVNPASLANFQTAMTGMLDDLVALASVDSLVLFHSSAPFTPTVITGLIVDSRCATQRRRLRP